MNKIKSIIKYWRPFNINHWPRWHTHIYLLGLRIIITYDVTLAVWMSKNTKKVLPLITINNWSSGKRGLYIRKNKRQYNADYLRIEVKA